MTAILPDCHDEKRAARQKQSKRAEICNLVRLCPQFKEYPKGF